MTIKIYLITFNWNLNSINSNEINRELYQNYKVVNKNVAPIQILYSVSSDAMVWWDIGIKLKFDIGPTKPLSDLQKKNKWESFKKYRNTLK